MTGAPNSKNSDLPHGWTVLIGALWVQLFAACIYGWRFGVYYDYGWYVPPLFAMFMWRIRGLFSTRKPPVAPKALLIAGAIGLGGSLLRQRWVASSGSGTAKPGIPGGQDG